MKMGLRSVLILFAFLSLCLDTYGSNKAARAIIVKGNVQYTVNGKKAKVKRNQWLPEGAQVSTSKGSFAKLLFIDRSSINVGPSSTMKIETFPKNKAGIISLVKGKIRSKVSKNYMDNKETNKSKLFIKTKTAAMGVRGTDFQVSFNEENQATSLVTFEGAVAMGQINGELGGFNQNSLENIVSSSSAVMVRRGQFSGASPRQEQVTAPTKISPIQLETMEKNEVPGLKSASSDAGPSHSPAADLAKNSGETYRSIVPPGMDAKVVANAANSIGNAITKITGSEVAAAIAPPVANLTEGIKNLDHIAPKAGGFVDIDTAQYIPPPAGSTFDANTQVYVPSTEVGHVDPETGDYKNDAYILTPQGFVPKVIEEINARRPASIGNASPPPPEVLDGPTQGNLTGDSGMLTDSANRINPNLINTMTQDNSLRLNDFQNSDNNLIYGSQTTNVTVRPVIQ